MDIRSIAKATLVEIKADDVPSLAAGVAFKIFLAIFPSLIAVVAGSILTFAYSTRFVLGVLGRFGDPEREPVSPDAVPPTPIFLGPSVVLTIFTVVAGLAPVIVNDLVRARRQHGKRDKDGGEKTQRHVHVTAPTTTASSSTMSHSDRGFPRAQGALRRTSSFPPCASDPVRTGR
jgi:NADH:ubiquinone oxidoreductase subunit 5 (subunit L)/multisubunit Na+/H+ antiporter MnhA subunit